MVLLQSRRGSVIRGWIYECPFCEREKSRDAVRHTNDTQMENWCGSLSPRGSRHRFSRLLHYRQGAGVGCINAHRVTETSGALSASTLGILLDVVYDVVWPSGICRYTADSRQVVKA